MRTESGDRADLQKHVPGPEWNELQFVSWSEFRQMGPSILGLEITRMDGLVLSSREDTVFHNSLVRARFALKQFVACLEHAEKDTFEATCAAHLRTAIMSLSFPTADVEDAQTKKTCGYVLDRLNYVYHRIRLIY